MVNLILVLICAAITIVTNAANAQLVGARSCDAQELNADGTLNVQNFVDLFGYGQGELRTSNKISFERTVSFEKYLATPHITGLAKDLIAILTFHSEAATTRLAGFTKGITENNSRFRRYDFDARNKRFYETYKASLVGKNGSTLICTKNAPPGLTPDTAISYYQRSVTSTATGGLLKLPIDESYFQCDIHGTLADLSSNLNKVLDEVYRKVYFETRDQVDPNFYLEIQAKRRRDVDLTKSISSSRKTLYSSHNCNVLLSCEYSVCTVEPSSKLYELTR